MNWKPKAITQWNITTKHCDQILQRIQDITKDAVLTFLTIKRGNQHMKPRIIIYSFHFSSFPLSPKYFFFLNSIPCCRSLWKVGNMIPLIVVMVPCLPGQYAMNKDKEMIWLIFTIHSAPGWSKISLSYRRHCLSSKALISPASVCACTKFFIIMHKMKNEAYSLAETIDGLLIESCTKINQNFP